MANLETGNSTAGLANIDGNFDLMTSTPQVNTRYGGASGAPNYVGASRTFFEKDSGLFTGSPVLLSPYVTYDDNLQVGQMTPLLDAMFNATSQDTSMWYYAFTTMTAVQAGGFLTMNSGNIGTAATGCYVQSKRYFNLTNNAGLRLGSIWNYGAAAIAANQVLYFGLGIPSSTTAAPTDGIWFQYSSAGLIGTVSYNGTVTQTGAMPVANPSNYNPSTNANGLYQIRIHSRFVEFWYNDNLLGSIVTPAGQGYPFMTDALPAFAQYVNTGTVSGSTFTQWKLAAITVDQLDSSLNKPYPHIQAAKGLMAYQGTSGGTMGTTALYSNSLAAGAGVAMTNTATGPGTGLGGQFSWLPTLAVGTDGILSSYQVSAGGINQIPRSLYITGVRIQSIVTTALTGGPVYALYSLAFGHTAVSLATGESGSFTTGTTKAPRRVPLGIETFPVTAAVGVTSATNAPVYMPFASPVVVNPGEFIAVVAKNIGTVTSAGAILSMITFDGYWE